MIKSVLEFFHGNFIFLPRLMLDRRIREITRDDEENAKITSTCKHVDERRERGMGRESARQRVGWE